MTKHNHDNIQLLQSDDLDLRLVRLREIMSAEDVDAILISSNANIYYLTGRVFCGYIYVPLTGNIKYVVRRPSVLQDPDAIYIRKIEDLPEKLNLSDVTLGLEMSSATYSTVLRIKKAFGDNINYADASSILMQARAVKTDFELDKIRNSGIRQTSLYERIPRLYQPGMRDIDLQIEIESAARKEGCLGQFRINGDDMELFMGSILVGDNADNPSPYDFAMGGAGLDPSLPVGADGSLIRRGESVMVDVNGNFTGYMTDMTRCYAISDNLSERVLKAHQTSIDICNALAYMGRVGVEAKKLYEKARLMACEAGFENEFMGHKQHAGFVGHGVGIEINELPVLAPRSKSVLQAGNVIAIEPKFVIPGVGAVGIENTYVVKADGPMECVTHAPTQIIYFE
ncbi:MAG: Xaa-Pro peptidase family protein [Muribaculaceae bacterium]|nr:Xaa-Pro peptidase family protein [Muribaculaceae bacterium]